MSDLIRKQDALDALKEYEVVESDNFTRTDPITMMTVATIANCIEAIVELPSAEPEQRWIPVTEALPEICEKDARGNVTFSKFVWSCQKCGDGFFWQSIDKYTTNNGGGWLSEVPHDDPNDCCKVVAWMPLPKPYGK